MAKTKKTPQESKTLSLFLELESSVISGVTSPNDICAEEMRMKNWYPTWRMARPLGGVLESSVGKKMATGTFTNSS